MKKLLPFLILITTLLGQTPEELDRTLRRLTPDLVDATIAIMLGAGSGSGVIVSPEGLVVTAAHVTSKPGQSIKVLLSDGRELPATSLGVDHSTDGALLQINAPGPFPFRPYTKTKNYKVGDWTLALGHPGGPILGRPSPVRLGRILEAGTKSGFDDAITTTATVISGDSGGPLFNLDGEVIGINSNIAMPWRINKHVPLPAIVARWDALMNNETIGRATQLTPEADQLFDEPYAALRKKFNEALRENADSDPEAAALLARPRLLDPHHMQEFLDRWSPDPEAPKAPQYGLILDPTTPRILELLPDSPAAQSLLQVGDLITSANNQEISSTVALALQLRNGGPLTLTTDSGKSLTLNPGETIARRQFPQPVAGVIEMMISDSPDLSRDRDTLPPADFLAALQPLQDQHASSVLALKDGRGRTIAAATVIHEIGQLITKASEIENISDLTATHQNQDYPVTVLATDKTHDLALIQIAAPNLTPVSWTTTEPEPGQLIVTATPGKQPLLGVITQPTRPAPKLGFEPNYTSEKPSAYLGITFTPDSPTPQIDTIQPGSPADRVGLLEGDLITHFEGQEISSLENLAELISKRSPGERVTLRIKRDEESLTLEPILDARPPASSSNFDRRASQRDQQLSSLSARGGKLSSRKDNFPRAVYHDQALPTNLVGTPLLNLQGQAIGINIARAMRHRTLAIPVLEIDQVVAKLRTQAARNN